MSDRYEAMIALTINGVDIELAGDIDNSIFSVGLTDYALDLLRSTTIGNLHDAVGAIIDFFNLADHNLLDDVERYLKDIPGVSEVWDFVVNAPIFLTALEFVRDDHLVLGVMVEYPVDIKIGWVSRVGVTMHKDLKPAE